MISETFGNFALEESIIGNLNDAKRFLKPGGVMMPMNLRQFVAPVMSDRIQKSIDTWSGIEGDMKWTKARETGLNNMYVKDIRPEDLLKDGTKEWDSIDFTKHNKEIRHAKVEWTTHHSPLTTHHPPSTIHGFALWWESDLAPGISLSTSPFAEPTHWQQIYLPLLEPLTLQSHETLELILEVDSRYDVRINVAWKTTVKGKDGTIVKALNQDMRKGFLLMVIPTPLSNLHRPIQLLQKTPPCTVHAAVSSRLKQIPDSPFSVRHHSIHRHHQEQR